MILFVYYDCARFSLLGGLALVVDSRGYSLVVAHGLLIEVASLDAEHKPLSTASTWA